MNRTRIMLGLGTFVGIGVLFGVIFGGRGGDENFNPVDEYRMDSWIPLQIGPIDFSINRAVFYLLVAMLLTVGTMMFIANRMQAKPNRWQAAVEALFTFMRDTVTRGNMPDPFARRWFPVLLTLFVFLWWSNIIAYIPTPTNTHHPVEIFGISVPTFGIYGATANIATPLALTVLVWLSYHIQGIRAQGLVGYFKSWVPAGVEGAAAGPIFVIEVLSHLVRLISLSVRLFANILAGHLLIHFMAGGLAVILGITALAWFTLPLATVFFMFEIALVATLQAFIFATLTAIYLGGAVAEHH
jgi:F-type H+-transporting ATPase subunit a